MDDRTGLTGDATIERCHRRGILTWRPNGREETSGGVVRSRQPGTSRLGLGGRRDGLVYVPGSAAPDDPRPLLIMFHGAGASGLDVMPMVEAAAEREAVLVLAPDSRGATWDMIQHEYGPDVAFLDHALNAVLVGRAIDVNRVALAGFSDGASYALSLGLINGELVSDVLAFSPGFVAPTRTEDAPRIFISHGREDPILPIERCGRRIADTLQRAGYDLDYREFSGGHVVPVDMIDAAFQRFVGAAGGRDE